jgi:hypothetical protein
MNGMLDAIFSLGADGSLGFGDEGTRFEFARALPAWLTVIALLICIVVPAMLYRGQLARSWRRGAMSLLRSVALVVLLIVLMGPQLVRDREQIEPDWVVFLVDRSASNTVPDAPGGQSRDAQLRGVLDENRAMLGALMADRRVLWLGFDGDANELELPSPDEQLAFAPLLPPADGRVTRIGAAMDDALERVAGRPVAGMVIFSDGRSSDAVPERVWQRLSAERIPVFSLPLGNERPVRDAAARSIDAPGVGFLGDTVPVRIEASLRGIGKQTGRDATAGPVPPSGTVRIEDSVTGRELARMPLDAGTLDADGRFSITIPVTPNAELTPVGESGTADVVWRLVIDADDDLIADNNTQLHEIRLVDRPIRVAYFDGYPRWENRFLKNMLLREGSIESAGVLLSSSRSYLQEGDIVLDALPASPEEWAEFDVVILGDLRAELLSPIQQEQLRDLVALRGAGLLWIAGPGATPDTWFETPLGDLLPLRAPSATDGSTSQSSTLSASTSFITERTPLSERLGLFDLAGAGRGWPEALSNPNTGWAALRWSVPVSPERVKPAAEVLIEARDLNSRGNPSTTSRPLVMGMRFGVGRVLFVGTDEIWRWRYGRGEDLPERFWLPMIRSLARESIGRTGAAAVFEATPSRIGLGAGVGLRLRLADQALIDAGLRDATVEIRLDAAQTNQSRSTPSRSNSSDQSPSLFPALGTLRLTPDQPPGEAAVSLSGVWAPTDPGRYRLRVEHPLLAGDAPEAIVTVLAPDDELANPDTDHALLRTLAEQTSGAMFVQGPLAARTPDAGQPVSAAATLGDLPGLLPNRTRVLTMTPEIATLWDRPFVFIILLLLLAAEWIMRRLNRLD